MRKIPFNGTVKVTQPITQTHKGTDYALENRTAIFSAANGIVVKVEKDITQRAGRKQWIANTANDPYKKQLGKVMWLRSLKTEDYGNFIKIDHGGHISTLYAHLDEVLVYAGQKVAEGELIGYSDSSGNSTGGHLHYEIRENDVVADPNKFNYDRKLILEGGVDNKLYELETSVGIIVPLYVRSGPARAYRLSGSRELRKGDIVDVQGYVEGEEVDGNKLWYKSKKGNYFWCGGTNKPDPELLLSAKRKDMTVEEKNVKLAEFELRKQKLDARRAELDEAYKLNEADLEAFNSEYEAFMAEPVEEPVVEAPVEEVETPVVEEVVETLEAPVEVAVEAPVDEIVLSEEEKGLFEKFKAFLGK